MRLTCGLLTDVIPKKLIFDSVGLMENTPEVSQVVLYSELALRLTKSPYHQQRT